MKSTKVKLLGELGERFVPEIDLFVSTPKEAIAALNANFPEFESYLNKSDQLYKMIVHNEVKDVEINHENNLFPCTGKTITIAPLAAGSGGGIGRILTGVALLGVGILTGGTGLIIAGALALGQALFFGSPGKPDSEEDPKQSLVFTGQTTTTAEGNKIPIVCGHKYRVGVQIVSFSIKSEYNAG